MGRSTRRLDRDVSDEETEALRAEQERRAAREEELAEESDQSTEEAAHRRRADKARYLEEKLEERAQSEEE
jgi:hypothetical protein